MSKILNVKSQGLCAPGYVFRVTWWHLVVSCIALQRSMAAIIKMSIYRGPKVDMAASVDIDSVAGCASSPTLLSSGAAVLVSLMEQTGWKRKCVRCVIVFLECSRVATKCDLSSHDIFPGT